MIDCKLRPNKEAHEGFKDKWSTLCMAVLSRKIDLVCYILKKVFRIIFVNSSTLNAWRNVNRFRMCIQIKVLKTSFILMFVQSEKKISKLIYLTKLKRK